MIRKSGGEYLCFVLQAPKGTRMHDAIAVALEFVAVRVWKFRITAAAALLDREAQPAQPDHFCGMLERAVMAARLMGARVLLRSGSSNFRASCGFVFSNRWASANVACSLDTTAVG